MGILIFELEEIIEFIVIHILMYNLTYFRDHKHTLFLASNEESVVDEKYNLGSFINLFWNHV